MTKAEVMALLKENQNERGIDHWNHMGHKTGGLKSFGIGLTQLRKLAKKIGRDHELAMQLWNSNNYDAKIIGLLIDDPKQLTRAQVEQQAEELNAGMLIHVFSSCNATLPKTPFAIDLATEWMDAEDSTRRRCAWGLIYEISKFKGKKAPDEAFFMDCIKRIRNSQKENAWVRESMNGALMGIGKRSIALNQAAINAAKSNRPLNVDYGDDNSCEPINVLKHLTSDYLKKKFGLD
jgi:3-methyladenine DNA glycosylase AlkD